VTIRRHARGLVGRLAARVAAAVLVVAGLLAGPGTVSADEWRTAGLSFSDELGNFRLLSVSGLGTVDHPIVIVEEIFGDGPATLVVRGAAKSRDDAGPSISRSSIQLAVIKVVINSTKRRWAGFDLELQEAPGVPSTYGDGLSFDQVRRFNQAFRSDRFLSNRAIDEPYDRIRFMHGSVMPGQSVRFDFFITDPTPVDEFFLLQDGRIMIARAPAEAVLVAETP
jgi:hypothetical protein